MTRLGYIACMLASSVLAQEAEPTAEDCPFLKVFERNDAGQWQVKAEHMPLSDLPQISFTDVDCQALKDWIADKEAEKQLQDQKWAEAWTAYEDAIAQPWNDFLDQADDLSHTFVSEGMKTDAEVVQFISENTFVDGKSLSEIYPAIADFLTEYRAASDNLSDDTFNFDAFRMTPRNLQVSGYFDAEGNYHPNQAMVDEYESTTEPEIGEQILDQLEQAAITYGYDPEVVQAWLSDKTTSWTDLQRVQDANRVAQAQADVAEAADYIKAILDNAAADFKAMGEAQQDALDVEAALNEKINELKVIVDTEAQANIDKLAKWMDLTISQQPTDDVLDVLELSKTVESQPDEQASQAGGFACGMALLGAAAISYMYMKGQDSRAKTYESGSDESDEGFTQV